MISGIYCYQDTENKNQIVYIGKDKRIYKNKRHKDHLNPSNKNKQKINQILQNNPNRYKYVILTKGYLSNNFLNAFERIAVWKHSPKFNFTRGGDGVSLPRSQNKQTKSFARIIKAGKNKQKEQVWKIHYDNKVMGKSKDKEFLEQLLKKYFDEEGFLKDDFEKTKQNISQEIKQHGTKKMSLTQSEKNNTTGYRNVSKKGDRYIYRYTDKGIRKHIQAYSIEILQKRVQEQKLRWEKF